MKKQKLFSPGPVMVEDNVRKALLHPDICHRSSEFEVYSKSFKKRSAHSSVQTTAIIL